MVIIIRIVITIYHAMFPEVCGASDQLPNLHLHQNTMKKIAFPVVALAFCLLLTNRGGAETIDIPEDEPAISLDIPHSWKPAVTDKGIGCESPDKVATIYFEVTPAKELNALIDENIEWLTKDQEVKVDKASEEKQDFEVASRKWGRISWNGDSKDWGPATVGFLFTDAGDGKILTVTYWITKEDQEKDFPIVTKILESVKQIGS
jgi:hypothetical protein